MYSLKTVFLLLIFFAIILGACSKDERENPTGSFDKITLGVPASDYPLFFALVRLAKEEGFFKESGLDVVYEFYPHGVASLKAIQTGEGTV